MLSIKRWYRKLFSQKENMPPSRYAKLERDGKGLTQREIEDGWHFCDSEWDGMLIHRSWEESNACTCFKEGS